MKHIAFLVGGGASFGIAAVLLGALYWFAPVVPCRIDPSRAYFSGPGSGASYEDLCTGDQAHSYGTGATAIRSARLVQSGLFVMCLLAGLAGGGVAGSFMYKRERRARQVRSGAAR